MPPPNRPPRDWMCLLPESCLCFAQTLVVRRGSVRSATNLGHDCPLSEPSCRVSKYRPLLSAAMGRIMGLLTSVALTDRVASNMVPPRVIRTSDPNVLVQHNDEPRASTRSIDMPGRATGASVMGRPVDTSPTSDRNRMFTIETGVSPHEGMQPAQPVQSPDAATRSLSSWFDLSCLATLFIAMLSCGIDFKKCQHPPPPPSPPHHPPGAGPP